MKLDSGRIIRVLTLSALIASFGSPALATNPRNPQVVFNGASLQAYFNSVGQTINVNTDQFDIPCWSTTVSNNATFTIQLELGGNAAGNSVGVYNCSSPGVPTLYEIFPGAAAPGWFAVASFNVGGPGNLVVNVFNSSAILVSNTAYAGVDASNFGFYLQGPSGANYYSQDARNGGDPQALVYAGTGTSAGQWWLAFEDVTFAASDKDFDDFVMFMESVNKPVPTLQTTWGGVKVRLN
jgi:hypothetical protein